MALDTSDDDAIFAFVKWAIGQLRAPRAETRQSGDSRGFPAPVEPSDTPTR